MKLSIQSAEDLGLALRAVRKDSRVRLDDLALTVRVSKQTATNVEQGKGKLSTTLAFLQEMGITLSVDIPEGAFAVYSRLRHERNAGMHDEDRARKDR